MGIICDEPKRCREVTPPLYKLVWLWLRKGCAETPEQITDVIFRIKDIAPADLLE